MKSVIDSFKYNIASSILVLCFLVLGVYFVTKSGGLEKDITSFSELTSFEEKDVSFNSNLMDSEFAIRRAFQKEGSGYKFYYVNIDSEHLIGFVSKSKFETNENVKIKGTVYNIENDTSEFSGYYSSLISSKYKPESVLDKGEFTNYYIIEGTNPLFKRGVVFTLIALAIFLFKFMVVEKINSFLRRIDKDKKSLNINDDFMLRRMCVEEKRFIGFDNIIDLAKQKNVRKNTSLKITIGAYVILIIVCLVFIYRNIIIDGNSSGAIAYVIIIVAIGIGIFRNYKRLGLSKTEKEESNVDSKDYFKKTKDRYPVDFKITLKELEKEIFMNGTYILTTDKDINTKSFLTENWIGIDGDFVKIVDIQTVNPFSYKNKKGKTSHYELDIITKNNETIKFRFDFQKSIMDTFNVLILKNSNLKSQVKKILKDKKVN